MLFVVVAASFPQSLPPISTNFRPERPKFQSQRHFLLMCLCDTEISVGDRDVCGRQRCLCGQQRCLCARQRCLWATEMSLCATQMSLWATEMSLWAKEMSLGDRDVSGKSIKVGRSGARREENPEAWRRTCGGLRSVIRIGIRVC